MRLSMKINHERIQSLKQFLYVTQDTTIQYVSSSIIILISVKDSNKTTHTIQVL